MHDADTVAYFDDHVPEYSTWRLDFPAEFIRHLIVVDEAFSPKPAVDALFYVKKGLTRLTSKRVGLFGYWNNIGPPVVSYYSERQLLDMVASGGRTTLADSRREPERLSAPAVTCSAS